MRRATFLASVRSDLLEILSYITEASGSVSSGQSFVRKLRDKCHRLAAIDSVVGRTRPDLRADIRSFPFENYVIFFRYVGERFEVVNILERHRDVESVFAPDHRPNA